MERHEAVRLFDEIERHPEGELPVFDVRLSGKSGGQTGYRLYAIEVWPSGRANSLQMKWLFETLAKIDFDIDVSLSDDSVLIR